MLRGLLTAALIALTGGAAPAEDGFEISAIRAHLFYEYSGRLSEDEIREIRREVNRRLREQSREAGRR